MIINIKNSKFLQLSRQQNIAFGIQKWLLGKNMCGGGDQVKSAEYEKLLTEFCSTQPEFDASKIKKFESVENFVNNRFEKFKQFCIKQIKKEAI